MTKIPVDYDFLLAVCKKTDANAFAIADLAEKFSKLESLLQNLPQKSEESEPVPADPANEADMTWPHGKANGVNFIIKTEAENLSEEIIADMGYRFSRILATFMAQNGIKEFHITAKK